MKKINSQQLLDELQSDVRALLVETDKRRLEDPELLLTRPAPDKWSVIQVLEHLNSYGRFYLPALEKALGKKVPLTGDYKPGWLGDYFARLMKPGAQGRIKSKMSSPTHHIPDDHLDPYPVFEEFVRQQRRLLVLLELAANADLGGIRVPISLTRFIRLKLGDTFRFFIAHQQRHFVQIGHALETVKSFEGKGLMALTS